MISYSGAAQGNFQAKDSPATVVRELLTHETVTTTKRYAHLRPDAVRQADLKSGELPVPKKGQVRKVGGVLHNVRRRGRESNSLRSGVIGLYLPQTIFLACSIGNSYHLGVNRVVRRVTTGRGGPQYAAYARL